MCPARRPIWSISLLVVAVVMTAMLGTALFQGSSRCCALYGPDGATGTLVTGQTVNPALLLSDVNYKDVMVMTANDRPDQVTPSVLEIPIINRAVPAISYAVTEAGDEHVAIVRGYVDPWLPE